MTHLIIDSDYLCHRIYHSGTWKGGYTFLAPVFLRDVELLVNQFSPDRLSFCFDSRHSKRREAYPGYKQVRRKARKALSKKEKKNWRLFCKERSKLRNHLKLMGFKNIFLKRGYESDDLIASLVQSSLEDKKASNIIVSADHDLYQLISSQTSIYLLNKKKLYTLEDFTKEWGISPIQWIDVKSIAGCSSDNIIGIDGVGEILAAKYIRGQVKSSSNLFRKIAEKSFVWRQNFDLVRLPYCGCPQITSVVETGWRFKTPLKGIRNRG